jgi:hypothetical protein
MADDAAHALKARPESWLVGAFLVLFGVAISAAMPQISAAVRGAVADAAKNGQGADQAQRPGIRFRLLAVRFVEPKASGAHDDFIPAHSSSSAVSEPASRLAPAFDLARHIRARGINVRAPPALRA